MNNIFIEQTALSLQELVASFLIDLGHLIIE